MRRARGIAAGLVASVALCSAPAAAQDPAWRTRAEVVPVHYTIDATLVETGFGDGVRIVGDETIVWTNTSREPVKVLYFHTYANAFRNTTAYSCADCDRSGVSWSRTTVSCCPAFWEYAALQSLFSPISETTICSS